MHFFMLWISCRCIYNIYHNIKFSLKIRNRMSFSNIAWNMREYDFSLTRIPPYRNKIVDSVLIRENTGIQWNSVFLHTLCSVSAPFSPFNFESIRCVTYWTVMLKRKRCLFQSKKSYLSEKVEGMSLSFSK